MEFLKFIIDILEDKIELGLPICPSFKGRKIYGLIEFSDWKR
jgi:hypothetical protein